MSLAFWVHCICMMRKKPNKTHRLNRKNKQGKKEKPNHVHEYINYTSDWHSHWDSFKLCYHNYTYVKALSHFHRGHSVNLLCFWYLREHDLGSTMMQIRAALFKTARSVFMKQGVQMNNLPKTMNLASWNLKHSNMLPTEILLGRTSLSATYIVFTFLCTRQLYWKMTSSGHFLTKSYTSRYICPLIKIPAFCS